jgi:hypothetical protein
MNPALELLKASAIGPRGLESFLQTHELTPELAGAMRELFTTFVNTDQFENAELAASVLALLWLRLGNFQEGLRNLIDHLQLRFRLAESPEAYIQVRTQALAALSKAVELEDHEFAFRAAVLAADASYFGHAAGGLAPGLNMPLVLADCVAAAHRANRATTSPWFPRFVSLFAGILQMAASEHLSREDQENADCSLRQLAGEVDLLLPTTRHFPDDPEKASQVATLLAALVANYGQ